MRFEGRRWIRVPRERVSDRLVTEPLPVADPADTNHVRYFCTSLLALPERSLGSSKLFEWSEQWGGDMESGGRVARPMVFSNVERQWVWEIRSVLHHIITIPPPGAATSSEVGAGAEQAETFNVELTLQRPMSLWGQDGAGVVYSSAPLSVRSKDEAQISVQGKDKVELRLQVSRQHDASLRRHWAAMSCVWRLPRFRRERRCLAGQRLKFFDLSTQMAPGDWNAESSNSL